MNKLGSWAITKRRMYIDLENAREQYKALGYPHRTILNMRCSACGKVTMVDNTVGYRYCPHCGTEMVQED